MSPVALVGERLANQAIAQTVLTSSATTTAASSAASTALLSLPRANYEGGSYRFFLWAQAITKGTTSVSVELWVDSAFNQALLTADTNAANPNPRLLTGIVSLGPGSHVVAFNGFVDAGTGTLVAGNGATGQAANAIGFIIPA